MTTLRQIIKNITTKHLKETNSFLFCQNVINPNSFIMDTLSTDLSIRDKIVELSTSDCSNSGWVVGAALMESRPFYVVRFQGFQWLNASFLTNYASISKPMQNIACPIFVRSIARCGNIGPVASNSQNSLFLKSSNIKIYSPMTPKEYQFVYDEFMKDDEVYIVSEHIDSYNNEKELKNHLSEQPDITLLPIGITRFNSELAREQLSREGIICDIIHQIKLKPYIPDIIESKVALVIDDDYTNGGIAKNIAYDNMLLNSDCKVHVLGLKENRVAGFYIDNLPPSVDEIVQKCKEILKKEKV